MNDNLPPEQPEEFADRTWKARERGEEPTSLARKATRFLLIAGGAAAVGVVIVPGQVAGASRTARLEWQHRKAEIAKATEQTPPIQQQP
jgi:hypothetical protein